MVQFEEHSVQYGDQKTIFYLAAGPKSAPLLIFLHGWPGIAKTWKPQLEAFTALGFRVVAPDMPGYGQSTARKVQSDYAQENIIPGLLALLADTGRKEAIWIAHDMGSLSIWSLARTHPEVCKAIASFCVPYGDFDRGLEELLKLIDRDVYPEDQYPYGQWSYQVYYEQFFEKATAFYEKDTRGFLKLLHMPGNPSSFGKPASTANVMKDGGWIGGIAKPPPASAIPDAKLILEADIFEEFVASMEKTGWAPANSWYMNHKANREYNLKNTKNEGKLKMPILFVHARYDLVCATVGTKLMNTMRANCENLTETIVDSGHWVGAEKPKEANAAIARWLVEEVREWWPGQWTNGWVKRQNRDQQKVHL